jgi:uncharacterized membrane protein YgdD (TMEM256/DUF423 family)
MNKFYTILGGLAGFLGVALGAFGAHGLRGILTPEMMEIFRTGILYQLIHAVALTGLAINGSKFNAACLFFLIGIVLFSFSLYIYALTGISFWAMITPIGGLSFLIGWVAVAVAAVRK